MRSVPSRALSHPCVSPSVSGKAGCVELSAAGPVVGKSGGLVAGAALKGWRLHRAGGGLEISDAGSLEFGLRWGGILDAGVIDAAEGGLERLADHPEVAEGEVAVVELTLCHALADDTVDKLVDPLEGAVFAGSDDGLDGVGEHDDGGLTALRPRAGVAGLLRVDS